MRRQNRIKRTDNKNVWYIGGSVVCIAILAAIAIFIWSGGSSNSSESKLSTAKVENLVPNNAIINTNSKTEQASTQIGKSVNEVQNSLNTIKNTTESLNKNNITQNVTKENSSTNTTTTAKETNTKESTKDKNQEAKTQESKEEKTPVFVRPVEGEIIREYAKDKLVYSETLKEWITHPGIDIKAEKTSIVKSAADGRVSSIKNDPRYGLTVTIEHQAGYKTVYSNLLTAEFITEGEEVTSGQTIGTVGNTATFEVLDEDHLHFEILKNNENVDPNIYVQ